MSMYFTDDYDDYIDYLIEIGRDRKNMKTRYEYEGKEYGIVDRPAVPGDVVLVREISTDGSIDQLSHIKGAWIRELSAIEGRDAILMDPIHGEYFLDKDDEYYALEPLEEADPCPYQNIDYDDEEIHAPTVSDGDEYTPIRPAHYHEGGIDVFKYAAANFNYDEIMGYHKGSIIKYVSRAGKKDNELQDLRKAETHIKTLIGYLNMEEAE